MLRLITAKADASAAKVDQRVDAENSGDQATDLIDLMAMETIDGAGIVAAGCLLPSGAQVRAAASTVPAAYLLQHPHIALDPTLASRIFSLSSTERPILAYAFVIPAVADGIVEHHETVREAYRTASLNAGPLKRLCKELAPDCALALGILIGSQLSAPTLRHRQDIAALLDLLHPGVLLGSTDDGSALAPPGSRLVEGFIDEAVRVGKTGLLIRGWILSAAFGVIETLVVRSFGGCEIALAEPPPSITRADVISARGGTTSPRALECGFAVFVPVPELDPEDRYWLVGAKLDDGAMIRIPFLAGDSPSPLKGIERSISFVEESVTSRDDIFERAVQPAIDEFWRNRHGPLRTPLERVFGEAPRKPTVSIIVPIYGRLDFARHQLVHFSLDPDFVGPHACAELIYVLDDPARKEAFFTLCTIAHFVYGVPFRVLVQPANLGYSAANNAGFKAARGDLLLMLNSDVMPKTTGWVSRFTRHYTNLERCGVLGCRLLFEDGSIQHAGMTFRRSPLIGASWCNDHPGKGMPSSLDPHDVPAKVPAVTGACMMVARSLMEDLGGLSENYVIGDFEDSDFCLKAHSRGWNIWYTPDIELYHLERQSMSLVAGGHQIFRQNLTFYNMWQHTRTWGPAITALLEHAEGRGIQTQATATL